VTPRREGLHTVAWGSGRPVVFLHGLGGSTHIWDGVRSLSDDAYRGMAVDLLGFGRSPKPADESYDVQCHLRHLVTVIPAGSVVVGHSAGALLALALAAQHPRFVRGLVLCSLPAYPDAATARREVARLGLLARMTVRGTPTARAICWLMCHTRWIGMLAAPLVTRLPSAVARDSVRHTYASYDRTLRHVVVEHRATADLARVDIPVVVVHGRDDDVVPLRYVQAAVSPGVTVRVVEGDHLVPLHNPEACAAALGDILVQSNPV